MLYSMAHPNYVYRPRSPEERAKLSRAHKRRLGIPDDCVRIYGLHVPAQHEHPLRYYASWVRQNRGLEAAQNFIRRARDGGKFKKPTETKYHITDRRYTYRPRPSTVNAKIAALAARAPLCEVGAPVLYGIRVPASYLATLKPHAEKAKAKAGRDAARWIICEAWEHGWPPMEPPDARVSVDLDLVDALLAEHASLEDVADFLGLGLPYLRRLRKARRAAR